MEQVSPAKNATYNLLSSTVAVIQEEFAEQVILRSNIVRGSPPRPSSNTEVIPMLFGVPPLQNVDQSSEHPSSLLVAVLVPVLSIIFIIFLTTTAFVVRKYYKSHPKRLKSNCAAVDLESGFEEKEPLRGSSKTNNEYTDMRIIPEPNKDASSNEEKSDEVKVHPPGYHPPASDPSLCVAFPDVKLEENKEDVTTKAAEDTCDRPNDLNFLAASAAFQAATLPALKRLPYTPDPDYLQCEVHDSPNDPSDGECEDKIGPLAKSAPKTKRMKPRGLLERRGSNVALTITLRAGEKSNVPATIASAKSPRPLAYLQKASSPLSPSELHVKSCDASCLQREFWEIPMNHPSENQFNVAGHGTKNRYRTILPNEHSRVKLPVTSEEDPLSTYINANYVRDCTDLASPSSSATDEELVSPSVTHTNAAFIATQGPMANTVVDFWRMVWQENVATVVMITKLKERKEKCTQYLPIEVGDTAMYENIAIEVEAIKKFEHFAVRSLKLTREKQTRVVNHYWYTTWMDHGTPEKTRGLLELVQEVSIWKKPSHGPMVIHCSAGIGRTGCYIAVTVGCQQLMKTGRTDILRLVSQMRLDRGGMVQTWEQYQFIHQALSRYGRILAGENVTTPSTTASIRSPPNLNSKLPGPKVGLTIEIPRPATSKQRRSLSEANLPSPKEARLNMKNAPLSQSPRNNNSPKSIPSDSNRSSRHRKVNMRLPKSETPPSSPPKSSQSETPPATVKPTSSPALTSPLGRLCLQSKDLNTVSSTTSNGRFQSAGNGVLQNGRTHESEPISQPEADPKKAFNFSFPLSNPSPVKTTTDETTVLLKNTREKHTSAFSLPDANPIVELSNEDKNGSSNKGRVTPESGTKPTTPGTAANFSHFIFPLPEQR